MDKFYEFLFIQPNTIFVWVNYDEIPATLAGIMGTPSTLEHRGAANVIMFDEKHFKRMATRISTLAVSRQGDGFNTVEIKPNRVFSP